MSLVDRVRECARFDPQRYRPFRVEGVTVGQVSSQVAEWLRPFKDVFAVSGHAVGLDARLTDFNQRTDAVAGVLDTLSQEDKIPGWRDEVYSVGTGFSDPPLFTMERAAVPLFGVKGYGIHINGYVLDGDRVEMWIGRRSSTKPTGPGLLDQVVAGGQPAGMPLEENLTKECLEEAGIPEDLSAKAVPAGSVSYRTERAEGLRDDVLFNYDLKLPAGFEPQNQDGEVEAFYLWPMDQVIETLERPDEFKFNSALVVIDFLVRWGFIGPEFPDYAEIVNGLGREPAPPDKQR